MIAVEGTVFALSITSYLYLKGRVPYWPPGVGAPALRWGTLNVFILLVSAWPNLLARRAAERFDLGRVRLWMFVCMVFALAFNVVRFVEFGALNVRWDTNAYGSITWTLLGLHTTHVADRLPGLGRAHGCGVLRPDGRAALRRRLGERDVLELRGAVLGARSMPLIYLAPRIV